MGKAIDKTIGVSRPGYIAKWKRNGELAASSTTFNDLVGKKIVRKSLGNGSLVISHVDPEGMIRIY